MGRSRQASHPNRTMMSTGTTDPFAVYPAFFAGTDAVVVAAPAKLNLFLEILRKRPDGFHELESLMVGIDLFDTITVRRTSANVIALTCEPAGLPTNADNLVIKAAEALRTHVRRPDLGAELHLNKRIPQQAGLAGGSSDAALTLLALNEIWKLALTRTELAAIAATVGSDVAFFLTPPAAWCTGRGEVVTPERVARPIDFVLVCPPIGLATVEVYRRLRVPATPVASDALREAVASGNLSAVGESLFNRLEEPAFELSPMVQQIRHRLDGLNPWGARMSGSGSAVFAVCQNRADAIRLAATFRASRPVDEPESRVLVVRSLAP